MPAEVSPESKLYVKEEIEKSRKEIKEEIEKVSSKATKTFTTVAIVVRFVTGLGIFGLAAKYIDGEIKKKLEEDLVKKIRTRADEVEDLYIKIKESETYANEVLSSRMIIGTIVPYGGKIEDTNDGELIKIREGWVFCNGASLDREKYKYLFDVIGEAFGAPDPNTFNLPDLRGRFVRGVDHGQKRDPDAQFRRFDKEGGNEGDNVGSLQEDALKSHSHPLEKNIYRHHRSFSGASGADHPLKDVPADGGQLWSTRTNPYGASETRPKNVYVNWIIKAR